MATFDELRNRLSSADPLADEDDLEIDPRALEALANEFGGLAGWKCKEDFGEWSREGWDELMIRLYLKRDRLDGALGAAKRGKAALDAMSDRGSEDLHRLIGKLQQRRGY